ncbi:MAG: hypothetical protein C0469_16085 [Cyanobacteria bacterium DS2.3.42]|nr:hypothetical protein [Cyanobacteria bacterium DS2.3.42]
MSNTIREYRVEEKLSDGRTVVIQLVDPNDKTVYTEQTYHLSRSALYLKFLTPARELNERELAYLTDCNLYRHVALFAAMENNGKVIPVGVSRYVMPTSVEPSGSAELAFAVSDEFLGCGIETILLTHLRRLAKEDGLQAFFVRVPVADQKMLDILRQFDQELITVKDSRVTNVLLPV